MSKITSKVDEENGKLRMEIKKLRTELKEIKKKQNFSAALRPKDRNRLVLEIQDKLEMGMFSPPKKPGNRSPLGKNQRIQSRSPSTKKDLEGNKENLTIPDVESPNFLENKKEFISADTFSNTYLAPSSTASVHENDTFSSLDKENKLLKQLNTLRQENEKLRKQLKKKKKNPKTHSRNISLIKKPTSKKHSISISDLNSSSISLLSKTSKSRKNLSQIPLKNLPAKAISRSSSFSKSPLRDHFSDIFSFTNSAKKSLQVTPEAKSLNSKSPTASKKSLNITPRSKHCENCDKLLHKGFSTNYCSKHE